MVVLVSYLVMRIRTTVNRVRVGIDLPGLSKRVYELVARRMDRALSRPKVKNREVICDAFLYLLQKCPIANPSDLWHHVVYRHYCKILNKHRHEDPSQSWVRASGDALEMVIERRYTPFLAPHGISIQALFGRKEKTGALREMRLGAEVGHGKLDVALRLETKRGTWEIFGGVHVKASLAERVSDDVPASRSMMRRGYFSPLWTLDVKSFPPPHGDLVNRGELGTPEDPSEKRRYIEEHGEFDNCYSANSRTVPSDGPTPADKRVYRLDLSHQPDSFAQEVIARANRWRAEKLPKR